MKIGIGASHTETVTVNETNTASALGSGLMDVFATPMMVALIECAASECLKPFLEESMASVGTHVNVSHDAATPIGMRVSATATVIGMDKRTITFAVEAKDAAGSIGKGTHTRAIIDRDRFMKKVSAKAEA